MIPRILEEDESMIGHHLPDETDTAGLVPETEDLDQVLEIEDERNLGRKIGSNKLLHPKPKIPYLIQAILRVMFQQYIINIR